MAEKRKGKELYVSDTEKMFGGKKEAAEVLSPVSGQVVPLSEVNDPAFAQEILGKGVAVKPSEGEFRAPLSR